MNRYELPSAATFSLDQLRYRYPREVVPEGMSSAAHLRDLTEAGIRQRWPDGINAELRQQIEHELRTDLRHAL